MEEVSECAAEEPAGRRGGSEHENGYVKAQRENTEETLEGLTLCNGGTVRQSEERGSSSAAMQTNSLVSKQLNVHITRLMQLGRFTHFTNSTFSGLLCLILDVFQHERARRA